ncbi:MAG: DAPG hydrolase family protein [Tropicimonas sp.]|uniref:DAPG hydrolase family protein n=1 Tax=Tropicimonas sp. TaxID=2067044 RepID=UPI003A880446
MRFEERNDLLKPGYLPFESGVVRYDDGHVTIAALTRMPGCTAAMVHWWFGWLGGTEQYKLWHPIDHFFSDWEDRGPDGNYYGAKHLVHESMGGKGPVHKLRIHFRDPHEVFDPAGYDAVDGIAVCARPGSLERPINLGHMCHFVRNTDFGCEMRTRFWLGDIHSQKEGETLPEEVRQAVRKEAVTEDFATSLHQHAQEEMGYLADILPMLHRQITMIPA